MADQIPYPNAAMATAGAAAIPTAGPQAGEVKAATRSSGWAPRRAPGRAVEPDDGRADDQ